MLVVQYVMCYIWNFSISIIIVSPRLVFRQDRQDTDCARPTYKGHDAPLVGI